MFSVNSTNSVTKIFVILVKGFEPLTSCVRDQDATHASKTHVRDWIFKLTPIHVSVIQIQIPWIHWIFVPFMENLISSLCSDTNTHFGLPKSPVLWFQARVNQITCILHFYTFMGFLYLPTGLLAVSMTDWYLLPHIFSSRDRRQSLAYQPKHSNSH